MGFARRPKRHFFQQISTHSASPSLVRSFSSSMYLFSLHLSYTFSFSFSRLCTSFSVQFLLVCVSLFQSLPAPCLPSFSYLIITFFCGASLSPSLILCRSLISALLSVSFSLSLPSLCLSRFSVSLLASRLLRSLSLSRLSLSLSLFLALSISLSLSFFFLPHAAAYFYPAGLSLLLSLSISSRSARFFLSCSSCLSLALSSSPSIRLARTLSIIGRHELLWRDGTSTCCCSCARWRSVRARRCGAAIFSPSSSIHWQHHERE